MSDSGLENEGFRLERPAAALTRRRFLTRLGLLAGAGALVPLLGRLRGRRIESVEVSRPGLGTWVRIVARDRDGARATRAVEKAYAAIGRVDEQMSIHRRDSQVSRVNAMAGRGAVAVESAVLDVVERACAAARHSAGIYDPTVLPLMRLYGFYQAGAGRFPSDREIARALDRTGWANVVVDRARGTLGLTRDGAGLDLGSIGKGWAVDRAVDALRAEGIRSGMADVGGNVYGLGTPDEDAEGWAVGVTHPVTGRVDCVFRLHDAAVATSGNHEQSHLLDGIRVGHLLDARRGRPADGHLSASASARTATEADELSTVAFLLGPSRMGDWPQATGLHFIG
jgi:thiamine biosynthesis lipoprotein